MNGIMTKMNYPHHKLLQTHRKRYGGYAKSMAIHGKHPLVLETMEQDVHFALAGSRISRGASVRIRKSVSRASVFNISTFPQRLGSPFRCCRKSTILPVLKNQFCRSFEQKIYKTPRKKFSVTKNFRNPVAFRDAPFSEISV